MMFELHELVSVDLCVKNLDSCMWEQVRNMIFSPRRVTLAWAKTPENPPYFCMKPRLGELKLLEREALSSKWTSLAWARVCPGFYSCHCLEPRSGETYWLKRDGLSPGLDCLAWARITAVGGLWFCCKEWSYMCKWNFAPLVSYMLEMLC